MAAEKRALELEYSLEAKKLCNDSTSAQPGDSFQYYSSSFYQVCEHRGNWMSLYDANSGNFYYQNTKNFQTQWEKPSNWDNLPPVFNPWIKMKSSVSNQTEKPPEPKDEPEFKSLTSKEIEEKLSKLMKRPARRQADPGEKSRQHWIPEGSTEYNIWYDKWVGENWHPDDGPAETRCVLEDDAGFTTANLMDPKSSRNLFCLYFAKGCCHLGRDCGFFHSIPTDKDERRVGLAVDCFGRERHLNHKENLGGVGSFEKDCTTLYVGGLGSRKAVERELWEEFGEWGEIEDIRVINKKNIAFVRYKNRLNAEFAKIAMGDQRLGCRDVLNVRWANDDPNPRAYKKDLDNAREKLVEAAHEKGIIQELESRPQPIPSGDGVTAPYPNTDAQYSDYEYWSWYYNTVGYDNQNDSQNQYTYSQLQQQLYARPEVYIQPQDNSHSQQKQQENYTEQQGKSTDEVNEDSSRLDRIFKQMESNSNCSLCVDTNQTAQAEMQNKESLTKTNSTTSERSDPSKDPYRN